MDRINRIKNRIYRIKAKYFRSNPVNPEKSC
jgi:hypothetical protein